MSPYTKDSPEAVPERCGIIIVDVQEGSVIPTELVERIEKASRHFKKRVFTKFVNREDSLFHKQLGWKGGPKTADEVRLLIKPRSDDLELVKYGYGLPEQLLSQLKTLGCDEFVVCGAETDACVLAVLFSLFDAGIRARVETTLCNGKLNDQAFAIMTRQFRWPPKKDQ